MVAGAAGGSAGRPSGAGRDFFVSYTRVDRVWAEWIAWTLEEAGYSVLIQAWDFVPGSNWVTGMDEGVARAARTVAVLSAAYAGSVYGRAEWQAAWAADPGGAARKLLVMRVEDCARPGLLDQVVSIDLFEQPQDEARSEVLRAARLAASGGRDKPPTAPVFPGGPRSVPARPVYPGDGAGDEPARPPAAAAGDGAGQVTHDGDNHVSGLSGSGDGPVVGVNYGTIQHRASARTVATEWRRHALVDHDRPFGIDAVVGRVAATLCSPSAAQLVSLFGDGGIGKTTVAYEAARACAARGHFERIAWASAKNMSAGTHHDGPPDLVVAYWLDVVRSIADQLGLDLGVSKALWEKDVARGLRLLTADRAFLVVVDNLESTEDAQGAVDRLAALGLTGQHRVVVTTRWSVQVGFSPVQEFRVTSMRRDDALALIRHLGSTDGDLGSAPEEQLGPILDVTEGNPFLIKLVVRHYLATHRSLDVVIGDLRDLADGSTDGPPALGHRVREHLYLRSLTELERRCGGESANQLMACFCLKEKGEYSTYDELMEISGIGSESTFRQTLVEACRLALVRSSDMNRRYSVHSLLHEFTCRQLGLTSPLT